MWKATLYASTGKWLITFAGSPASPPVTLIEKNGTIQASGVVPNIRSIYTDVADLAANLCSTVIERTQIDSIGEGKVNGF